MSEMAPGNRLTEKSDVGLDLLDVDDDLAELSDHCSFLCDAVVSILRINDGVDSGTLGGLHAYSEQIKQQVRQLRDRVRHVRAQVPVPSGRSTD